MRVAHYSSYFNLTRQSISEHNFTLYEVHYKNILGFLFEKNLAQMVLVSPRAKVRLHLRRRGRLEQGQQRSQRWRRGAAWAQRASWSWPSSSPSSSSCSSSAATAGNQSSQGWFGKRDSKDLKPSPPTNNLCEASTNFQSATTKLHSSQNI